MESRKQRIQHWVEIEGIPRNPKGNSEGKFRSTSVQQTWRAISPDWMWRTENSGRDVPRTGNIQPPKAMTDFLISLTL